MVANADPLNVVFTAETLKRRSVHGAAATFVAQALKFVLQFGSQVALARLLDPASFGLVAMVAPIVGFVQVLNDLGFAQAVVQRSEVSQAQISALFWISLAIGSGLTLLAMASAPLIAFLYGEPRTLPITMTLASLILLSSLAVLPSALLNRQMRFVPLAVIDISSVLVGVGVGVVAAWCGLGYASLVLMQVGSSVTSVGLIWVACAWRPSRPARTPGVGSMIRFGANLMGANLATYFSMSADNMLVGAVNGEVALGLYDRSYNLAVKPQMQLMAPVSRVAVPILSRLAASPENYRAAYLRMVQLVLIACAPGMIFCVFMAEPVIRLLFGARWIAMAPIFAWICFGGTVAALFSSMSWLFTTQNRTREQMVYSTWCSVISIASFAVGVVWGALGVAMVSALSFVLVQTPLLTWAATRAGPVTAGVLVRVLLPLLAAAVATAAALAGAAGALGALGAGGLVLAAGLSYAVFGVVVLCLPGGRTLLRDVAGLRSLARSAA